MTTATAIRNQGTITAINTNDPRTFENVIRNIRIESETVLSMVSMSLENLFIIRPRGVVSKKLMGARMTVVMAPRWRIFDADCVSRPMDTPDMKKVMVRQIPRAA